jgi:hypothetical protein
MEGTVPYLQVASVVRWRVNDLGKVVPGPVESKSVVVQDTGNPDSRIIASYLRDELEKLNWKDPEVEKQAKKLVNEAADGLLTVTGTNRFEVTAPPLPADYPLDLTAIIAKGLSGARGPSKP